MGDAVDGVITLLWDFFDGSARCGVVGRYFVAIVLFFFYTSF